MRDDRLDRSGQRSAPVLEDVVERRILTFLNSFPSVGWAILGVVWFKISTPTVLFIQTAIVLPFCIVNALAEDIAAGRLRHGQALPTHRALAKALGVDLTTVTRAYAVASRQGLT